MTSLICNMEDCVHRSKYPLRKWKRKHDDEKCYGCTLRYITISKIFDPDGDAEGVIGRGNMAACKFYEPREAGDEAGALDGEEKNDGALRNGKRPYDRNEF